MAIVGKRERNNGEWSVLWEMVSNKRVRCGSVYAGKQGKISEFNGGD